VKYFTSFETCPLTCANEFDGPESVPLYSVRS
jgi:hypothetical protein